MHKENTLICILIILICFFILFQEDQFNTKKVVQEIQKKDLIFLDDEVVLYCTRKRTKDTTFLYNNGVLHGWYLNKKQ